MTGSVASPTTASSISLTPSPSITPPSQVALENVVMVIITSLTSAAVSAKDAIFCSNSAYHFSFFMAQFDVSLQQRFRETTAQVVNEYCGQGDSQCDILADRQRRSFKRSVWNMQQCYSILGLIVTWFSEYFCFHRFFFPLIMLYRTEGNSWRKCYKDKLLSKIHDTQSMILFVTKDNNSCCGRIWLQGLKAGQG